ncbi:hypothetical protein TrVE_jg9864 [Triparma verrucosa]|uniref:Uncharacterized protein n=1 Tax=Triparma verrucosa TaxID=1606542 RepID=A0A9W6ZD51_9STRA|nr:hypothetical protein TrVE_jg9864 [Triparma verrucosa]
MSSNHDLSASQSVEKLQADLNAAVALLQAERRANDDAVSKLNSQLGEATAQLDAERKAKDEAVRKLTSVVAEINSDATLQARRRRADATATSIAPLDPDNPMVRKVGPNMLGQNMTINDCRSDVTIHEEPQVFLDSLLGDQTKVDKKGLYQKNVGKGVAYWSFIIEGTTKACNLLLHLRVVRQDEDRVLVRVESIEEEEVEATSLPNPHSTATKKVRLFLKEATIVLQPLQFGQTLFTFTAQVDAGEITTTSSVHRSTTEITRPTTAAGITSAITGVTSSKGAALRRLRAGSSDSAKATKLFFQLANI